MKGGDKDGDWGRSYDGGRRGKEWKRATRADPISTLIIM